MRGSVVGRVAESLGLRRELREGEVGRGAEAARAVKTDARASRKPDVRALGETVTASGAKWAGDGYGNWVLLESHGAETEALVRELFDHLGLPLGELVVDRAEEARLVAREASLVEFGLGAGVAHVQGAHGRKNRERDPEGPEGIQEGGAGAEARQAGQDRVDTDGDLRPSDPARERPGDDLHGGQDATGAPAPVATPEATR